MAEPIIRVKNLSKRYRIGSKEEGYRTIGESIMDGIRAPFKNIKTLRKLTKFEDAERQALSSVPSLENDVIWALKDVSFDVNEREVVGIIGRNGAGKSTLLKIMSRITEPTEGEAQLRGRVASLLEVGTGFHPELTGRENIFLNGAILGMKKDEIKKKFDEIVTFAEIEKFLDTPVKRYSSGMYVRLAFAVAAHLEPEILFVDEVLAVGDAQFQKKCLGKMRGVAKEGRTVLFVSHNMAAVEGLCSRCMVLNEGQLTYDSDVQGAISYYLETMESSSVALKDRKDREGNGRVRAVDIKMFNQEGRETNSIGMGESFSVEVYTVGRLEKAVIGILIGNVYRKQIIRGYTWEQVSDDIELTETDVIRCYFEDFPMMHGSYNVHIWIGQQRGECSDYVENAAALAVEPRDVFKTSRRPDPLGGIAFCKTEWEVNGLRYV